MNGYQAAQTLREHLGHPPWLSAIAVGVIDGRETIILYTSSGYRSWSKSSATQPPKDWEGFPIIRRHFGSIAPVPARKAKRT